MIINWTLDSSEVTILINLVVGSTFDSSCVRIIVIFNYMVVWSDDINVTNIVAWMSLFENSLLIIVSEDTWEVFKLVRIYLILYNSSLIQATSDVIPDICDIDTVVNATVSINIPSSNQVAIFGRYNNGTNDATAGTDRLPGKQVAMNGRYNNRTTTSSILAKYSR